MARQKPTRSNVRRPGLRAAAKDLAVNYSHLRRVVIGDRSSVSLMTRYRNWMNTAPKAGMNENPPNKSAGPTTRDAALENLRPELFAILDRLGLQVVLVLIQAELGSPVWAFPKIGKDLGAELQSAEAGHFDSDTFFPGEILLVFQSNRLAKAMTTLKASLDARSLLSISTLLHVEAPGEIRVWFPASAELFNLKTLAKGES